jgi:hypothetical protein
VFSADSKRKEELSADDADEADERRFGGFFVICAHLRIVLFLFVTSSDFFSFFGFVWYRVGGWMRIG